MHSPVLKTRIHHRYQIVETNYCEYLQPVTKIAASYDEQCANLLLDSTLRQQTFNIYQELVQLIRLLHPHQCFDIKIVSSFQKRKPRL